ncbi:DUF1624 domain-containing protein [Candidatus Peregrinibacteria bacterium]|nr:DUF1624 domain-containing protein [Candidatus Peregrinibacteria bacterium]
MKKESKRFWEIDFLRGIAIIMMIIFHLLYNLNYFSYIQVNVFIGGWELLGKITFTLFLFLVGISLSLSAGRRKKEHTFSFYVYLKRGLILFSWGMIITIASYFLIPEAYIKFGILHLIGVAVIISYPFLRFRWTAIIVGAAIIALGIYLQGYRFETPYFYWLGITPYHFTALDHFPIFPYWGIVLIGLGIGNKLYKNFVRNFPFFDIEKNHLCHFFTFLGRHSLLIYLLHQPLLIVFLLLLQKFT